MAAPLSRREGSASISKGTHRARRRGQTKIVLAPLPTTRAATQPIILPTRRVATQPIVLPTAARNVRPTRNVNVNAFADSTPKPTTTRPIVHATIPPKKTPIAKAKPAAPANHPAQKQAPKTITDHQSAFMKKFNTVDGKIEILVAGIGSLILALLIITCLVRRHRRHKIERRIQRAEDSEKREQAADRKEMRMMMLQGFGRAGEPVNPGQQFISNPCYYEPQAVPMNQYMAYDQPMFYMQEPQMCAQPGQPGPMDIAGVHPYAGQLWRGPSAQSHEAPQVSQDALRYAQQPPPYPTVPIQDSAAAGKGSWMQRAAGLVTGALQNPFKSKSPPSYAAATHQATGPYIKGPTQQQFEPNLPHEAMPLPPKAAFMPPQAVPINSIPPSQRKVDNPAEVAPPYSAVLQPGERVIAKSGVAQPAQSSKAPFVYPGAAKQVLSTQPAHDPKPGLLPSASNVGLTRPTPVKANTTDGTTSVERRGGSLYQVPQMQFLKQPVPADAQAPISIPAPPVLPRSNTVPADLRIQAGHRSSNPWAFPITPR